MSNKYYELKWRKSITYIIDLYELEMKPLREIVGKRKMKRDRTSKEFFKFYSELFIGNMTFSSNQKGTLKYTKIWKIVMKT
jgi:hypothetical protein